MQVSQNLDFPERSSHILTTMIRSTAHLSHLLVQPVVAIIGVFIANRPETGSSSYTSHERITQGSSISGDSLV